MEGDRAGLEGFEAAFKGGENRLTWIMQKFSSILLDGYASAV
jgi:hypothetical protein